MTDAALVRKFGELAVDVAYLRDCGHTVAPFKGEFRIDREVVDGPTLARRAEVERQRRASARPPRQRREVVETTSDICGCGKPKSHNGMCSVRWAKRKANNGPSGIKAAAPTKSRSPVHTTSDSTTERPAEPVVPTGNEGRAGERDLIPRIAQLERDMADLFEVVADALKGRRETLIEQARGLAEAEAVLRKAA